MYIRDMRIITERSSPKKLTQEQLDKALDDHAEWLENKTSFFGLVRAGRRADFTGCDLRDLDFSERDLRHVIFKDALVTRAIFDGATLDSNLVFAPIGPSQMRRAFSTSTVPPPVPRTNETSSAPHDNDIDLDWNSFVNSRTPAEPQCWAATIEGRSFTWHPPTFPRPSAPPLEHGLEL